MDGITLPQQKFGQIDAILPVTPVLNAILPDTFFAPLIIGAQIAIIVGAMPSQIWPDGRGNLSVDDQGF